MLAQSFGVNFFLKTPRIPQKMRYIYLRVTVDGIPKEASTKRKWDIDRWDQSSERAIGSKEDAKTINFFIDSLSLKITQAKTQLMIDDVTITSENMMNIIMGKIAAKTKVLEEFQIHNDEMIELVRKGEYAQGTHERYVTARAHVQEFIMFKYGRNDLEFRELNYQFVKDYEFWLKTKRNCCNNTTLKYIANFKKIVLIAIDKDIIPTDPFKRFKGKKTKLKKKPLTPEELYTLETHEFATHRLSIVRDIFVFQCYTGLAYIDAYQLKKTDIQIGLDGERWIISDRQKTGSDTNIPLLPKAIEIMEKYKDHPVCLKRGSVLPVSSNQKMNEYLKEIGDLSGITSSLNTHKARRTFGSTVTLNNDVPIHVVKEMMGHQSVKQTEEYAITEQKTISRTMQELKNKLGKKEQGHSSESALNMLERLENEIKELKIHYGIQRN